MRPSSALVLGHLQEPAIRLSHGKRYSAFEVISRLIQAAGPLCIVIDFEFFSSHNHYFGVLPIRDKHPWPYL
jgi:hypothetical protein